MHYLVIVEPLRKYVLYLAKKADCHNTMLLCKQLASSPVEVWKLSPPQRLPLGIPIKIAIMEKIENMWGIMGMPRTLSFSFSPASPQHKEASSEERGLVVSSEKFKIHTSSNYII